MQRLVTMSVIRGEGECEVIVNHVVQKEIRRLQEINRKKFESEMRVMRERLNASERKRRKVLKEKLDALDARLAEPVRPLERLKFRIPYGWAWLIATGMSVKARLRGGRL